MEQFEKQIQQILLNEVTKTYTHSDIKQHTVKESVHIKIQK